MLRHLANSKTPIGPLPLLKKQAIYCVALSIPRTSSSPFNSVVASIVWVSLLLLWTVPPSSSLIASRDLRNSARPKQDLTCSSLRPSSLQYQSNSQLSSKPLSNPYISTSWRIKWALKLCNTSNIAVQPAYHHLLRSGSTIRAVVCQDFKLAICLA
jgi:hypothetical protein